MNLEDLGQLHKHGTSYDCVSQTLADDEFQTLGVKNVELYKDNVDTFLRHEDEKERSDCLDDFQIHPCYMRESKVSLGELFQVQC